MKTIATLAALLVAAAAHANPIVEKIVSQLEASPSGCASVSPAHPQRQTIEADIAAVVKVAPLPPGVKFEVMDCSVDGFVHKGRTIVISARLARMNAAQRFFIIAHELGHLNLHHHAAITSFVARAVHEATDEASARALVFSGLASVSHRAELDADAFAVRLMRQAGLDPEEAARIFEDMGEGHDNGTHPAAGKRARSIRTAARP